MKARILFPLLLAACADNVLGPLGGVRASDQAAWRAVPVIELERHTLFSTLPRETRQLSDGSELWDYSNCNTTKNDTACTSKQAYGGGVNTTCSGGQESTTCCHNQFMIRDGMVQEYRPLGSCYTDCSTRPGGVCK